MLPQMLGIGLVVVIGIGFTAFAAGFILGSEDECPLCRESHYSFDHDGILERMEDGE